MRPENRENVCPMCVGMNRQTSGSNAHGLRMPHVRRDEPIAVRMADEPWSQWHRVGEPWNDNLLAFRNLI